MTCRFWLLGVIALIGLPAGINTLPAEPLREWTPDTRFVMRSGHTLTEFQGKLWLIGGSVGFQGSESSEVWCSEDGGASWELVLSRAPFPPRRDHVAFTYLNRLWVYGGATDFEVYVDDLWSTYDGVSWTRVAADTDAGARYGMSLATLNGIPHLIGGVDDQNQRRNDVYRFTGFGWSELTASAAFAARVDHAGASFDPGDGEKMWIVGGNVTGNVLDDDVWYSSDGSNWIQATAAAPFAAQSDAVLATFDPGGGERLVFIGRNAAFDGLEAWTSTDGANWTQVPLNNNINLISDPAAAVHNSELVLAGGRRQDIGSYATDHVWASANLADWTTRTLELVPPTAAAEMVSFLGRLLFIGGSSLYGPDGAVWASDDGATWTLLAEDLPFGSVFRQRALVHDDRIWLLGGDTSGGPTSEVWVSDDGTSWSQATPAADWLPRLDHAAAVHEGKMFILGGQNYTQSLFERYQDTVHASTDGVNWTTTTLDAPWNRRQLAAAASYDGKLWLTGGSVLELGLPGGPQDDVWSSTDGTSWTLELDGAPWGARAGHQLVGLPDGLLLLGGTAEGYRIDDAWFSNDGVNWERVAAGAFRPRVDFDAAVLGDRLHVASGSIEYAVSGWSFEPWSTGLPVRRLELGGAVAFGEQDIAGGPSFPEVVTLTNTGNTPLNLGSVEITGADAGDFTFAVPPDLAPLAPGASRDLLLS